MVQSSSPGFVASTAPHLLPLPNASTVWAIVNRVKRDMAAVRVNFSTSASVNMFDCYNGNPLRVHHAEDGGSAFVAVPVAAMG